MSISQSSLRVALNVCAALPKILLGPGEEFVNFVTMASGCFLFLIVGFFLSAPQYFDWLIIITYMNLYLSFSAHEVFLYLVLHLTVDH
jgi:hypothetical protein